MRLIDQLSGEPLALLQLWIAEAKAAGIKEPNAMALATATPDGAPSVRVVLAKGVEAGAVHFFTNYESRKSRELADNPRAAATFLWADLARQVRLEGVVERLPRAASEAYFATRPRGSQLAAWASPQSRELGSYDELMAGLQGVAQRFGDRAPVPCPPFWGGFALTPTSVEFWLGVPDRLHDRVLCRRGTDEWVKRQLAP